MEMQKGLSAEAVALYQKRGFHFPVRVMSEAEAAERRAWVDRVRESDSDRTRKLDIKANLLVPWIDDLMRRPALLDLMEPLLGPDMVCTGASFRFKNPDGKAYAGWHQDTRYIRIRPSGVIAFLALSPCTPQTGCLRLIPGSHLWDELPHADSKDPHSILTRGQYINDELDTSTAVDVILRPGEAALFGHNCVHGSGPNSSDVWRTVILAGYYGTRSAPQTDVRLSAALVRGVDRYGHFDQDGRPADEFGSAAHTAHQRAATAMTDGMLYRGSDRRSIALD